ncbi:MAG: FG-GAP repeat protein [Myxococcales bacterium]|nr:FG-GAP repeat protein [Myxococcales bacterium]
MNRRTPWVSLALSCAAIQCRTAPTQVELIVGTDAPPSRSIELSVYSFDGVLPAPVAVRRAADATPNFRFESYGSQRVGDLVGSIGLLPSKSSRDARSSTVTVLLRARFQQTPNAPAATVEHVWNVTMLRALRGTTRVNLSLTCANAAAGCTSVAASACTVSVRCIEQGLTCGARGQCVEPELPVTYGDDAGADGGERPDGASGRVVLPPRPIAPLSTSTATSSRPEFRWRNTGDAAGARVEICRDRLCTQIQETFDADGERGRPRNPLPRGVPLFWRLRGLLSGEASAQTSPVWQLRSRALDGADATTSSGVEGDYNGDGATELAVRSPGSSMSMERSAVYVYQANAGGFAESPSLTIREMLGDNLGAGLAPAGDVNGDGFGDFVVSAPRTMQPGTTRGTLLVYEGSTAGLRAESRAILGSSTADVDFGTSVEGVGDFNGDGYGDVVVGSVNVNGPPAGPRGDARVYLGSPTGLDAARFVALERPSDVEIAADRVAGAGDLDGDGLADVLVHARDERSTSGAVLVYFGTTSSAPVREGRRLRSTRGTFGEVLEGAADFDGDGLADFAVGDWFSYELSVVYGARSRAALEASWTYTKRYAPVQDQARFATALASADVDNDGRSDLLVGASHETPASGIDRAGVARFFLSRAERRFEEMQSAPFDGGLAQSTFGWAVSLGDSDGDGVFEPCVGAFAAPRPSLQDAGFVRCFAVRFAGNTATVTRAATLDGALVHGWFGHSLAQ